MLHHNNGPLVSLSVAIAISVASVILLCSASLAQESTELEFILSCNPIQNFPGADGVHIHFDPPHIPEMKLLLIGAIRFYQLFISPQDMPACNFVPSCSQFGAEVIRRLGILRGILLTSDRLQRCNSMSISRYHTDYKSGKLVDPVQIYAEILR
jgi:putative membrane protein insertion efficiency factor